LASSLASSALACSSQAAVVVGPRACFGAPVGAPVALLELDHLVELVGNGVITAAPGGSGVHDPREPSAGYQAGQSSRAARARSRSSSSGMAAAVSARSRMVPLPALSSGWRTVKPASRPSCQP
jgi:hypothetical protein